MTILLTIVHVFVCVFLVIVVLLQSGKAADLAGAFGGMGSQTAFGPRGSATVLSKATTIAAGLFMVTSLSLAILATRNTGGGTSVLQRQKAAPAQQQQQKAPAPGQQSGDVMAVPKPGQPVSPGQPYMEVTPEGGGTGQKIPLDLQKVPAPTGQQPAPAKK
jgi:preprotein translocase subunit SecG